VLVAVLTTLDRRLLGEGDRFHRLAPEQHGGGDGEHRGGAGGDDGDPQSEESHDPIDAIGPGRLADYT
jgi:hypothetical protein